MPTWLHRSGLTASENVVSRPLFLSYPHTGDSIDQIALHQVLEGRVEDHLGEVLARIPEGSDYRPDPKSRTAKEIAWQIVCEEKMLIEALESGKAEWAPPPMPGDDEGGARGVRETESGDAPALGGSVPRALGRHARVLRQPAARRAHGVGFSLRHRSPSRADFHLLAADGIDCAPDLWTER